MIYILNNKIYITDRLKIINHIFNTLVKHFINHIISSDNFILTDTAREFYFISSFNILSSCFEIFTNWKLMRRRSYERKWKKNISIFRFFLSIFILLLFKQMVWITFFLHCDFPALSFGGGNIFTKRKIAF